MVSKTKRFGKQEPRQQMLVQSTQGEPAMTKPELVKTVRAAG
jgi:hypothetical protein